MPLNYAVPAPPPRPLPEEEARLRGQLPTAYDMGPGGFNASPQLMGRPRVPDPSLAAMPPSTNATGGPGGAHAAIQSSVFNQMYKLGKQMPGPANLMAGFGPQPEGPVDPFALLPQAPVEEPVRQLPALPPSPQAPDPSQYPAHLQQPEQVKPNPLNRFPRLAGMVGHKLPTDEPARRRR